MASALPLPRSRPADAGLDYTRLYEAGLERIRETAATTWTDHNTHDPGITTLELASYALTDLAYRASLPLEDLLVGSESFASLSAASVLPGQPLTILDYRTLMIDVEGVKNAWLEPVGLPRFADRETGEVLVKKPNRPRIDAIVLRGLYQPSVEYADDTLSNAKKKQIRDAVLKRLHEHRNLCEDFAPVKAIERQPFLLCGEVDLSPDADPAPVHLAILQAVQAYLAPGVSRYTRDELLARRKAGGAMNTPADLFDGPRLEHGFIDRDELRVADLRQEVRLSDVIGGVMDVPGVRAVREMLIAPEPPAGSSAPIENRWVVSVTPGTQPTLNPAGSRLICYKGHLPVLPTRVSALPPDPRRAIRCEDVQIPPGRARAVASCTPFRQHFPAVYGVGDHPLPTSATPTRRTWAAQFQAYLLFFEQVLANGCAQLAHLPDLFGISPADAPTYFTQVVRSATPATDADLSVYGADQAGAPALQAALSAGVESPAARVARRTRFLDHLLARFAERFHEYVEIMRSAFGATPASLLTDRAEMLADYPAIARERSRAFNDTLPQPAEQWDTRDNISGLEKRLARLLGIGDPSRRDLTTAPPPAGGAITGNAPGEFGYRLTDDGGAEAGTLLTGVSKHATAALAEADMHRALELGQWTSTYHRTELADGTWFFTIATPAGEVIGRGPDASSLDALEVSIVALRTHLRRHCSREGLYVIEHLLLRPEKTGDASLRFCVEAGCDGCADDDPYSFRLHVILPAYAGRFNDMAFRRFTEATIRAEVPAHLLPTICWADEASMAAVGKAWREWIEVRSGNAAADRVPRLAALVTALTTTRNVYPVQKLVACEDAGIDPPFILGRTALGKKQDND